MFRFPCRVFVAAIFALVILQRLFSKKTGKQMGVSEIFFVLILKSVP